MVLKAWQTLGICLYFGSICFGFRLEDIADGSEELLDLTLEFTEDSPYWPTLERKGQNFKMRKTQDGHSDEFGYYYHANVFSSSDHGGTHVDALNHVNLRPVNTEIDETPLRQYFGMASVIDITGKCASNPDYQLTVADVRTFESRHGKIPNASLLFVHTGWGAKINDKTAFWGTSDYFNLSQLHYPGVGYEAADWLVRNRNIKVVGVETASIDYGQGGLSLRSHATFLTAGINIIESVQNLDKMPPSGAFVFGLPVRMKGASGAPIRLVAVGWKRR